MEVGRHVRERTKFAYMLPASEGGTGEPSEPTAVGVMSAIHVTLERLFGTPDPAGRRITIVGLGQVGSRLARRLTDSGARLTVTDIDPAKKLLAEDLTASWAEPDEAFRLPADVLVPAALGGTLTDEVVDHLRVERSSDPYQSTCRRECCR